MILSSLEDCLEAVMIGTYYRSNTNDYKVLEEVMINNKYNLTERFDLSDTIIDIGAHIGGFSLACAIRGGQVIGFEPHASNAKLAKYNTDGFNIEIREQAVWRSDFHKFALRHNEYKILEEKLNTTDINVVFDGEIPTESVTLDSIIKEFEDIRLLKLSCEFSEYPILLTSKLLSNVQEIVGEYKNILKIPIRAQVGNYKEYNGNVLTNILSNQGFIVDIKESGIFHARR